MSKIHKKKLDISIDWLKGEFEPRTELSDRLKKSIEYWKRDLEKSLSQQDVDLSRLICLHLHSTVEDYHFMEAKDDRNVEHRISINKTK